MFFFPLFDDNPSKKTPFVTWIIIIICFLIFFYQSNLNIVEYNKFIFSFGLIPAILSNQFELPENLNIIHPILTLISSAFLHAGWMHILGNMFYLWIFGDNVEDAMGTLNFIFFYLICAISGGILQVLVNSSSITPMVGASGAIAGILGSYFMLYPKANVKVFFWFLIFFRTINVPAWIVLSIWIAGQFMSAPSSLLNGGGGVAYFAHIGGFLTGIILTPFMKREEVRIFSNSLSESWRHHKTTKSDIKYTFTHNRNVSLPVHKKKRKSSLPKIKRLK